MSTPLTASRFSTLVRAAGVTLVPHGAWQTNNRGNRGTGWGPVNGVMIHHDAIGSIEASIRVVLEGQSDEVPGPLYAGIVDKEGRLHMTGWGRCNHAGLGDDDVLRAVIREDDPLPPANEANTDGNSRFYGFTGQNRGDGRDPWPTAQLNTLAIVAAVICNEHNWTERSIIGHRDWQPGKPDPRGPEGYMIPGIRSTARTWLRTH